MNKLYRSRKDAMIAGVCGGLGMYLGIDSTLVRIFFFALLFFHGFGFWVYLLLALFIPRVPEGEDIPAPDVAWNENPNAVKVIGGSLVAFGLIALLSNLNIRWLSWLTFSNIWPVLLIAGLTALW